MATQDKIKDILIKEKNAEITKLQREFDILQMQFEHLYNLKEEQTTKVEKLKEEIDKLIKNCKAVEVDIGEYDKFISVHKLKEIINKIFSPENHTSKETHRLNTPLGVKPIILDDNEISIMRYAEEFPENWEKICESLENHNQSTKKEIKSDKSSTQIDSVKSGSVSADFVRLNDVTGLFKNRKKFGIKKEIRERIINVISSNIPKYHTLKSEEQGK